MLKVGVINGPKPDLTETELAQNLRLRTGPNVFGHVRVGPVRSFGRSGPRRHNSRVLRKTGPDRTETEIRKKSGPRPDRWSFGSVGPVGPLGLGRFWVCDAQP